MKKLLIPTILAVVLGLATGSAFSYKTAKDAAKTLAVHVADSLAKHAVDSTATADSVAKIEHEREIAAAAQELPLTPADSIRLAQNPPATLEEATHNLPNAVDPKQSAPAPAHSNGSSSQAVASASNRPAASKTTTAAKPPVAAPSKAQPNSRTAAPAVEPAATPAVKVPTPLENSLPERRISKIFGGMQSKDAAKILEQMSDSDIRVILGMMGDKQAAAILTALPAARAALISKSELGKASLGKDEKKPGGDQP